MSRDELIFDPFYSWLGIPPAEQPADYYRLLPTQSESPFATGNDTENPLTHHIDVTTVTT